MSKRNGMLMMVLAVLLAGTAFAKTSKYMDKMEDDSYAPAPGENESMVVFLRSSNFGKSYNASIYDITSDDLDLIGIINFKEKMVYITNPGEHLFMVIGENADYVKADLAPGKTYFVDVVPRSGGWKARFSMVPFKRDSDAVKYDLESPALSRGIEKCFYVKKNAKAEDWVKAHLNSIIDKKDVYMDRWEDKSEGDRLERTLQPQDGQ